MTAPLLPPVEQRSTAAERLRDSIRHSRAASWLIPLLLTVFAGILRLTNLGHPGTLAFDETYYVKDAWSLWTLGYEGTWGSGANEMFADGDTSALTATGSFVVHPPLGKWIIALGMGLLGPGSSVGWRLTTALIGTATVLLLYLVTRTLTRSTTLATLAGLFLAVDGLSIVMSRIALLDATLTFFILLGFWFILLDRRHTMPLLENPATHGVTDDGPLPMWGRVLWRRPWVVAAGVALGAAAAVKWSGLYALAALGLYLVVTDALARRRAGVLLWPTDAAFRQGPVSFLLLVPAALLTYLASWTGWFVTAGGYDRAASDNPLVALWKYHESILGFHSGLTSGHPYASAAWEWPLLLRPTAVWVGGDETCFGSDHCIAVISTVPNPVLWYLGVAAAVWLLYRFALGLIERRPMPWTYAIPLVGLAATWIPWLLIPNRTVFQFYTVAMVPFLVLALVLALREIAGRADAPLSRRQSGQRVVAVVVGVILAVSVFFYPSWVGMTVPYDFWLIHNWLPGWV